MKEYFRTNDVRLASWLWLTIGQCPDVEGIYPKTFMFMNSRELSKAIQDFYRGKAVANVFSLFEKYNALKALTKVDVADVEEIDDER